MGNLANDTLENIWNNSEKNQVAPRFKDERHGWRRVLQVRQGCLFAPCMVRNANESPTGNPLEINRHFCAVAAKNKQIVLDWREAKLKAMGK